MCRDQRHAEGTPSAYFALVLSNRCRWNRTTKLCCHSSNMHSIPHHCSHWLYEKFSFPRDGLNLTGTPSQWRCTSLQTTGRCIPVIFVRRASFPPRLPSCLLLLKLLDFRGYLLRNYRSRLARLCSDECRKRSTKNHKCA